MDHGLTLPSASQRVKTRRYGTPGALAALMRPLMCFEDLSAVLPAPF